METYIVLAAAAVGAYFLAPIIAGAFGFTSGMGAVVASSLWGGVLGGVIGGAGFSTLGIGSFDEGFRFGALVGGFAGGSNYGFYASPVFNVGSSDISVRLLAYGAMFLGIAELLMFIPKAATCRNLSADLSTSGLIGTCHD